MWTAPLIMNQRMRMNTAHLSSICEWLKENVHTSPQKRRTGMSKFEINESENGLVFQMIYQNIFYGVYQCTTFVNCKESKWDWIYLLKFMTLMNVMSMSIPMHFISLKFCHTFAFELKFICAKKPMNTCKCVFVLNLTCKCISSI